MHSRSTMQVLGAEAGSSGSLKVWGFGDRIIRRISAAHGCVAHSRLGKCLVLPLTENLQKIAAYEAFGVHQTPPCV